MAIFCIDASEKEDFANWKKEHDSELLDEVSKRINSLHYDTCNPVTRRIEHQLKAEVFKVINELKAEVSE